jgi:hypothetical protein
MGWSHGGRQHGHERHEGNVAHGENQSRLGKRKEHRGLTEETPYWLLGYCLDCWFITKVGL